MMFIKAKKNRNELRLPQLHYIVADDWIDKLGNNAFSGWLKFHTWVNRKDIKKEDISTASIPMSIVKVAEKLGIAKTTLYRTIIIPLWEYGLIDLIEYQTKNKQQNPINIIPYDYPQNEISLATKELIKCRDWKTDYNSNAAIFGRKRTTKIINLDRSKIETVDRSKIETVSVAKLKHNNVSNNLNNVSNNLIIDEEKTLTNEVLYDLLIFYTVEEIVAFEICKQAKEQSMLLYKFEIIEQLQLMFFKINVEGFKIADFTTYFLNGIKMLRQQRVLQKNKNTKLHTTESNKKPIVLYDWLNE